VRALVEHPGRVVGVPFHGPTDCFREGWVMPELNYKRTTLHDAPVMVAFYGPLSDYAFVWHGGAYIDVCIASSMGDVNLDGRFYTYGCQCINVYDYGTGETTIPMWDEEAFLAEISAWLETEMPYRG
jgi:hypothetical protein